MIKFFISSFVKTVVNSKNNISNFLTNYTLNLVIIIMDLEKFTRLLLWQSIFENTDSCQTADSTASVYTSKETELKVQKYYKRSFMTRMKYLHYHYEFGK